ncbi:hypothetical protein [Aeoliella sp. SH292]|uniref:hypothetical protein n=1 Tax=Aeoliella sp. SH292 TaxID=3454464 RepID=UPI003F9B120A
MNTATNYEPNPQGCEAAELPPVLVRVPWLGAKQTPAAVELARATSKPIIDRALFEPHQLVAAADMDETDFGTVRTHWRVDPPQDRPISAEVHLRRPITTTATPTTPVAPPASLPPALPVREVTTPTSEGITHLRFDPPISSVVEPPVQQPQPQHTVRDESSVWHEAVTALDAVLRRYHRMIMLAALIAAAGLMALVMDGRTPAIEKTPDSTAPNTIDIGEIGPMPLADVTHAHQPASAPESVRMAKGPGRVQRENVPPTIESPAAPLMLDPIPPHREPNITPIQESEVPASESGYPSTGDPAFSLTFPTTANSEPVVPGARLSNQLQSVPQKIQQ